MRAVVAAALVLVTAGCGARAREDLERQRAAEAAELTRATDSLRRDLEALHQDVAALRAELDQARKEIEATHQTAKEIEATNQTARVAQLQAVDALAKQIGADERRLDDLASTVGGVETTIDGLADQVARLEAASAPVPQSRLATGTTGPGSPTAPIGPEELFDRAMGSFRGGELGQAVLDFEEFVSKNPKHPLVANAEFWIGEAYFRARDFDNAASAYQKTVTLAPKGDRAADALLRLGLAFRALRHEDQAREAWSRLVRDFPDSEASKRAKTLLRESTTPAPGATEPAKPSS